MLCWGRGCAFVSTGNKKLWIVPKLIKIRSDWGDFLKILAADMKKETKKDCTTGDMG